MRDDVETCLRRLLAPEGAGLSLDADGVVTLAFGNGREVTLEVPAAGDLLFAHAPLCHVPPGDAEAMFRRALAMSLFGLHRPQSWIALDETTGALTLCATRSVFGLDEDGLATFFQDMLDDTQRIARDLAAPAPPMEPVGGDEPLLILRG